MSPAATTMLTEDASATRPRCHCGAPGVFGYKDRAAWPRRLASGAPNEINPAEVKLIWFCAEHHFAQWYADATVPEAAPCAPHALDGGAPWTERTPPPDLQEFISRFGDYADVSAEAWARWDQTVAWWQQGRRDQLRSEIEASKRQRCRALLRDSQGRPSTPLGVALDRIAEQEGNS